MASKFKVRMAGEIGTALSGAPACVVLGYRSLPGEATTRLRSRLRKDRVELTVVRTRVAAKALAGTPFEALRPLLKGQTAMAIGGEDGIALAKALVESFKGEKGIEFRGGVVEGRLVSGAEVQALARLPGRKELLSMIASVVAAPITNIAYGVDAILAGVARAVEAVRVKKAGEAGAAA